VFHRIIRPDGEIRHVHELARLERNATASGRLIGTVQDVTELKQAEQALIATRDEAERANNAKSEFLSSMSHELRTPMNAILGFGQLLEMDTELNEDQTDCVIEILKAGRHLLTLINEVLDLSKIESGNIELTIESLACAELVGECLARVSPLAQGRGITMNNGGLGGLMICADRTRLKQVLLNLLSNAIKYNSLQGNVWIRASAHAGLVRLEVSDTGSGISVERQQELFQPFSRLGVDDTDIDTKFDHQSTIDQMMGGIGVESRKLWRHFWIELPEDTSTPITRAIARSTR
jgi:signal transduction histidine kinase